MLLTNMDTLIVSTARQKHGKARVKVMLSSFSILTTEVYRGKNQAMYLIPNNDTLRCSVGSTRVF